MSCWLLGSTVRLSEFASGLFTRLIDPVEWRHHSISNHESSVKFLLCRDQMKPSNLKVMACLESFEIEFEVKILSDDVRTARLAADALGCEVSQIANSLIFRNLENDQAVLIMNAGGSRVDLTRVTELTGLRLGKADAEFVKFSTGFAIGGVPPVAHNRPLQTLLDISLLNHTEIWAAAGTPESVFRMTPQQLQLITSGEWFHLSA